MPINYRSDMLHDSSLDIFRDPVGALIAGTQVTLCFRTRLENVSSVYLCLYSKDFYEDYLMERAQDFWRVRIAAPVFPKVYWYYFAINIAGKLCYYGARGKRTGGVGCIYSERPPAYQLTVYDAGFAPPTWLQKSVIYQIFPDRFCPGNDDTAQKGIAYHLSRGRRAIYHEKWDENPFYLPLSGEKSYNPCDYFGGTLKGIEASLDYLQGMGITGIYLNPIFEAASNHRYNTADYFKIDPVLGDEQDFDSLCRAAQKRGIRIILDGVFSHTGSDSIYFNREGAYESLGAANSPDSKFYSWYRFEKYPDRYQCWWGFQTLPEVDEHDPGWQKFVITGKNSVIRNWIKAGAKGYRLDVADELPDDVLAMISAAAKQTDPEAVIIGEVWEDATTKFSYGVKRSYALGGMLDSVTNYPLRQAILAFLTEKSDSSDLKNFLVDQAANYPRPLYYSLLNLLSSHDVERLRTALSARIEPQELSREQQAAFVITDSQNKKGSKRQRLAAALQFCLPGAPCIYYGDEKGMLGFLDPFNRAPFTADCPYDLTTHYQKLAKLRREADALQTGHAVFFAPDADCLGVLRFIIEGYDALGRPAQNGVYFTAINRAETSRLVAFDFLSKNSLFSREQQNALRSFFNGAASCRLTKKQYLLDNGLLEISLKGFGIVWLKIA